MPSVSTEQPSVPVVRLKRGAKGVKPTRLKDPNAPILIRVISPGGKPLGKVTLREARDRIFTRLAKGVGGRGRREFSAIQMLKPQIVADKLPGGLRLHYSEDLGDSHHLCTLKRYDADSNTFRKWHPGLTFADVREGRMTPPKNHKADGAQWTASRSADSSARAG